MRPSMPERGIRVGLGARVGFTPASQSESYAAMKAWGLPVSERWRLVDDLAGVREFIRVAEEDRLRMLQSYSGAERRQDGSVNVVVLDKTGTITQGAPQVTDVVCAPGVSEERLLQLNADLLAWLQS